MISKAVLILYFISSVNCAEDCPTTPCTVKIIDIGIAKAPDTLQSMNGEPIDEVIKDIHIEAGNESSCLLNTTDLWIQLNLTDETLIVTIMIACFKPVRIYTLPYEGKVIKNAIAYISTGPKSLCSTSISVWNDIAGGIYYTHSLDLRQSLSHGTCNYNRSIACWNLRNISTLTVSNTEITEGALTDIISCSPDYAELTEVQFANLSWYYLPDKLISLFPNLQTLELPNNKFILPPKSFPWTENELNFPRNTPRSLTSDKLSTYSGGLNVLAHEYRRVYDMQYNLISNLSEYRFHGFLHQIDLKGNKMIEIGAEVFSNVTGLQIIDLSNNELKSLPVKIFNGLSELSKLYLGGNKIDLLQNGIFHDLQALELISLEGNGLIYLPDGLFSKLEMLNTLHLQNNRLIALSPGTLPVNPIALRHITVNGNRISSLPGFIFRFPKLLVANFSDTGVSALNFTEALDYYFEYWAFSSHTDLSKDILLQNPNSENILKQKAHKLRYIDLSRCKITSIYLEETTSVRESALIDLLLNFRFILSDNPLRCDCKIIPITHFINAMRATGILHQSDRSFNEWLCDNPEVFHDHALLDINSEETNCLARDLMSCPLECKCYERSKSNSIIVDCQHRNLTNMHGVMPQGVLELRYKGNSISRIASKPYMERVLVLDVSDNKLREIDGALFIQAKILKELLVNSNQLSYLSETLINMTTLKKADLLHNSFICDCKSLWMKHWIQKHKNIVTNWNKLLCQSKSEEKHFVEVEDSFFVCSDQTYVSTFVLSTMILVFVVVIGSLLYAFRVEIKVLLYVHFRIHPFDRKNEATNEILDCVVVHSRAITDWVMTNMVKHLENSANKFIVCDLDRDFLLGFSMHDNISHMINHSKRIIFCLSDDWGKSDEVFQIAWNNALKKIMKYKCNYGIIVGVKIAVDKKDYRQFLSFFKNDMVLNSSETLFLQKLIYSMPQKPRKSNYGYDIKLKATSGHISPMSHVSQLMMSPSLQGHQYHVFVSYTYADNELVTRKLLEFLECNNFSLCLPDRDYIVGAYVGSEILRAVTTSRHTLLFVSENHRTDDWLLFTFQMAYRKSLKDKNNHLIVITTDTLDINSLDGEIKHYLDTHISLNVNDRWFKQKLFKSLPVIHNSLNEYYAESLDAVDVSEENSEVENMELGVNIELDEYQQILA